MNEHKLSKSVKNFGFLIPQGDLCFFFFQFDGEVFWDCFAEKFIRLWYPALNY